MIKSFYIIFHVVSHIVDIFKYPHSVIWLITASTTLLCVDITASTTLLGVDITASITLLSVDITASTTLLCVDIYELQLTTHSCRVDLILDKLMYIMGDKGVCFPN